MTHSVKTTKKGLRFDGNGLKQAIQDKSVQPGLHLRVTGPHRLGSTIFPVWGLQGYQILSLPNKKQVDFRVYSTLRKETEHRDGIQGGPGIPETKSRVFLMSSLWLDLSDRTSCVREVRTSITFPSYECTKVEFTFPSVLHNLLVYLISDTM